MFVKLRPDTSTFKAEAKAGLTGAFTGVTGAADTSFLGVGKSAVKMTAGIAGISAATSLGIIGLKAIVGGAAETEQQLDTLQVVTGATGDEMEEVSKLAQQLGADLTLPGISAGDSARGMNELAKAGLNLEDTMGGVKGVLQLATAGELDVAEAAQITGGALNAFGLSGDKATHVADLLAGASIAATGGVGDMALALQQASAVSRQAGLSIEQTVGGIALLAKNGVLGSDAGTSFKTMLLKLIPATKEAAQWQKALGITFDETKSIGEQLPDLIQQYHDALEKLSPELQQMALLQIFGTDAVRVGSIFAREGADGYLEMTNAVNRTGAANELATARTKGFIGTVDSLKSSLQTVAESLGETVVPGLTEATAEVANFVGGIQKVIDKLKEWNSIKIARFKIPGVTDFGTGGQDANNDDDDLGILKRPVSFITDQLNALVGFNEELTSLRDNMADLRSPDVLDRAQTVNDAKVTGREVGNQFVSETRNAILANGPTAVEAARLMVTQVAEAGRASVRAAIAGAQQNLASLGSELSGMVGEIIESGVKEGAKVTGSSASAGVSAIQRARMNEAINDAKTELDRAVANIPINREIEKIRAQLDRESHKDDATGVRRDLRNAQEELADAQRRAQTVGKLDPAEQAQTRKFLRPFQEAVADARSEVKKFALEGRLDKLQKRLDDQTDDIADNITRLKRSLRDARNALIESQTKIATGGLTSSIREAADEQKRIVTQQIDDAIQAFNDELITLPELNKRLARILAENDIDYKNAGTKLGTAFVRRFNETLKGLGVQGAEIVKGPNTPGAGIVSPVVSASAAQKVAGLNNVQAQRALQEAQLDEATLSNSYLKRAVAALEGPREPGVKTSVGDSAADKANTGVQQKSNDDSTTRAKPRTRVGGR